MSLKTAIKKPALTHDAICIQAQNEITHGDWNWVNDKKQTENLDPGNPANYYESTLSPWENFPPLIEDKECELVVIGGGLLGASAALHLSESGVDTVLLEKDRIGSAASGRNGGQLTPGLARWEAESMLENLSFEEARRLWTFTSSESMSLIDEITARYGLEVDRGRGHLTAAVHPGHLNSLVREADARKFLGDENVTILGAYEIKSHIQSDIYHGGALDMLGGQVHSLALTRGLIYGFVTNGGTVHEQSEVIRLEETDKGVRVHTPQGSILARRGVILAVHSATYTLLAQDNSTTIPFYTYVGTTCPVEGGTRSLLPTGKAVYDTQFQIDYYRPVRNERLLFGGQGTGMRWHDDKTVDYLTSRLRAVFPDRDDLELEFAWSGTTDLTLNGATDCRKLGKRAPIYAVHGWSGHGIAQTVRIGKAIRDDVLRLNNDFNMLTTIKHRSLMIGRQLAPVAIPIAKTLMGIGTRLSPGKMVSF
ncbi:NAD(P)/FAD-dependent oxidoreductase [Rouxiella badensis]|uniref:FAD-dependent oxidoreductase n=1 Tax=Rouxiella badensis TaxID=1646377 RepID=A0A1X0WBL0_9GAMM|nr:FAD-dependent oxidoreductase [Rouxiella badensis]ORJ24170.1 FAD-dependent oxidoreductase [Rouxiella badensis]